MVLSKKSVLSAEKPDIGDDGYVLVTVLMIIAILTVSAAAIATISQTESAIVRNERVYLNEFYSADAGLAVASEKFRQWETQLNFTNTFSYEHQSETGGTTVIEAYRVITTSEDSARASEIQKMINDNKIPAGLKHIDDPMLGSGTGVTGEVLIKRYALSAKPKNGNVQVQAGVYKYIPAGK